MNAGNKSTDAAAFQLNGESQLLRVAVTQKCRGLQKEGRGGGGLLHMRSVQNFTP